jgi:chromosome partitioning protein
MKIVAIISQKGGSGKTTLALHLSVASSNSGRNTAVIDLDPQASSTKWADRRQKFSEVPVVMSVHASRLNHEMERVRSNGGEMIYLDTAPHSDSAALEAAKAADLILVPCRPAILDLEAISNTLELVSTTRKPIYVVLNAVPPNSSEWKEAAEAITALGVEVCPSRLVHRIAFSRSLINGLTAQEFEPDGKAKLEAEHLHDFVCSHIQELEPALV